MCSKKSTPAFTLTKQYLYSSFIITMLLSLLGTQINAQEKFTLNGYVKDAETGEELIGVTVYVKELATGTATNLYGFYALNLPSGNYTILYSSVGYGTVEKNIALDEDQSLNIELPIETLTISEVLILEDPIDKNVTALNMSRNEVDIQQVKKLPALFGEPDIIKTIQMMPGVITAGEGTSSFFVRGGSADQNLILIDEAPVYDPSHLFGLFSVFNADIIKDVELYKGGIPARYGSRLSSILEVRTKDGNNKSFSGEAGLGLLASKIMVEGPIKKEKSSFIISGRRSYVDLFLKAAKEDNLVHFYDINAKVNWKHNNNNRFFAAFYLGRDVFDFDDTFGFDWGNTTGTFRWNHLFSDRLFSNTSIIVSNFDYALEYDDAVQGFRWTSNLQEFSLKEDLNFFINPKNELEFGYHFTYRRFSPGTVAPTSEESIFEPIKLQNDYALDHAFYLGNEQQISSKLKLYYGARLSIFQNTGEADIFLYEDPQDNINVRRIDTLHFEDLETIKSYINIEPRFSARFLLNGQSSVKLSYNRMVQNTHLISSGTVPIPFNTWSPSNYYLKPQVADQVAVGYFRNFKQNMFEFSVESYYKNINNVTDFADNARLFFNRDLSTEFRQGKSWSYGLELMLEKKLGKFAGFASYTWSKTKRKVPGVNLSKPFRANYDRRHVFNLATTYELNEAWSFGANFTYSTGRPITVPAGKYEYSEVYQVDLITERNGYLLPDFHRMDLSATLTPRNNKKRKWKSSWSFSLYNVYSRKNAFTIYTRLSGGAENGTLGGIQEKEARMISLFPILPSVTYNITF